MSTPHPAADLARAQQLLAQARGLPALRPSLACFAVARLLREEGRRCQVYSQVLFVENDQGLEMPQNQVFLRMHDHLLDELGRYDDTQQLAADRALRWGKPVRSDDCPRLHRPKEEAYDLHACWGVSIAEMDAMAEVLRAEDAAQRLQEEASRSPAANLPRSRL